LGQRYATIITERCFDELDAPPCCLTSLDVPNPISKILEDAAMLQDATILDGLRAAARRTWK
jgi:pyruvate/2-oxoglutarate/acetoin dehydrogenase E1 component